MMQTRRKANLIASPILIYQPSVAINGRALPTYLCTFVNLVRTNNNHLDEPEFDDVSVLVVRLVQVI